MGKVLHASYSGYFPSCIGEERTQGVLNGSLEDLMYIYWRVKTWEIESVIGQLLVGDGPATWTFNQGVTPLGSINANTEEELVCGKTFLQGASVSFEAETPPDPPSTISGDFGMFFTPTVSQNANGLYQITFYIEFSLASTRIFFSSLPASFGADQGAQVGELTIKPINIKTPIYGSGSITGTMNISVRATEWWSYGGTYNTQTGEPL